MTNLLIHSMSEFSSLILPSLEKANVRNIAEVGSEFGGMSQVLADYCGSKQGMLHCVDPEPREGFAEWVASSSAAIHHPAPSLEMIDQLEDIDAWVVDGDHNYFTVSRELGAIDAVCRRDEKPLLAFLHDVSWPCARRDMYYAPDRIPEGERHDYSYDHGVVLENNVAVPKRGFKGNGEFAVALEAGGPRNGVLTAVEDFIAEADSEHRPLYYVHVPAVFGLGVIFDASQDWSDDMAQFLLPFHANPLLASLEENRLRNYLAVIDWQDRTAEA